MSVVATKKPEQSPVALTVVIALHVVALTALLYYPPGSSPAQAGVLYISMITQSESPWPVPQPPQVKPVKKVEKALTPPAPLETHGETAISLPPAQPAPAQAETAPVVANAPQPQLPEPLVLPRFDAAYLQNPPPVYPSLSRRHGEQGKVLLRVVVRPDGLPDTVELRKSSGSQRLDEAALEAVRRWRFIPARQGNTPVAAAVIVPIVFSLEG